MVDAAYELGGQPQPCAAIGRVHDRTADVPNSHPGNRGSHRYFFNEYQIDIFVPNLLKERSPGRHHGENHSFSATRQDAPDAIRHRFSAIRFSMKRVFPILTIHERNGIRRHLPRRGAPVPTGISGAIGVYVE